MGNENTDYSHRTGPEELARIEQKLLADPDNLELMDWVAFMFYSNGVRDKANEYYRRLSEARPRNPSYAYFLGNLQAQAGDRSEARRWWNRVLELDLEGEYASRARKKLASMEG